MTAAPDTEDMDIRDLIEAELTAVSAQAARLLHHPDCRPWVDKHLRLDHLLDQWRLSGGPERLP